MLRSFSFFFKFSRDRFLVAASIANVVLVGEWFNLFAPYSIFSFGAHPIVSFTSIEGILLAFCYLTFAIYMLLQVREALKGPVAKGALLFFTLSLLIFPLNTLRMYSQISNLYPYISVKAFLGALHTTGAWLVLSLLGVLSVAGIIIYQNFVWNVLMLLGRVCLPLLVLNLGQLSYDSYRSLKYGGTVVKYEMPDKAEVSDLQDPRIVWMIFDEFDYRLAFENRPSWLSLPNWDKLVSESASASQAYPPGMHTVSSIPGLLTGNQFEEKVEKTFENIYLSKLGETAILPLSDYPNVFSDAKKKHLKTGLFGWYLPYCQSMRDELDRCVMQPSGRFGYSYKPWKVFAQVLNRTFTPLGHYAINASTYDFTMEQTTRALQKEQIDLVFLHLPYPHAPWKYDAKEAKIIVWHPRPDRGYFENLALTDKFLGEFLQVLSTTERYANTTLIISSDHSWRVSEPRDLRVPFIVRMPDRKGAKINARFDTIHTRELVNLIQDRKIQTTDEVKVFLGSVGFKNHHH